MENLGDYEICNICKWEDDPIQSNDPNYSGGANKMSLNEARKAYREGEASCIATHDPAQKTRLLIDFLASHFQQHPPG